LQKQLGSGHYGASAKYAPWPLVIIVTGLVGIVWGLIIYIFYQLFVIKKAGKYEA